MRMNIIEILLILFLHWFADFVLQTDKMAQGKSKNWTDLISHTLTYFFVFYIASILYYFISDNRSISFVIQ